MADYQPKIIAKSDLDAWVRALMKGAQVVAPAAAHLDDVVYQPIESPEQIAWGYENTIQPPKTFLFPQVETLYRYHRNGGKHVEVEPTVDETRRVIMGLRCCDVSGVLYMDNIFAQGNPDVYYLARRANTTLISLTCPSPFPWCFCVCSDSGPFLSSGYDVQLTDLGERMLAEVGSAKGQAAIEAAPKLFTVAGQDALDRRHSLEAEAERRFLQRETNHMASAMRRMSIGQVEDKIWEAMAPWCLGCGGCNFLCPCCFCFNVYDSHANGGGERCRVWDSCAFPGLTREVSGHNPRPTRAERVERRFYHKLSYQYLDKEGLPGCVGCGRCVVTCLGTTTMPNISEGIRRGAWR
jgi:sulfhydrogenase subunit beta (sulfur reductase)